ncbi:hypothetical protein BOTBODRAFT_483702 [Botryobasidium botryosum FD-172 SS1]|uniref:Fungal-type protein kinase domain-containing protein n=1 Tax=Botryobasidium botryosum (strain FD-172 SS1) TaxID=930990 RepID=A0A067MTZ9_BOTB1|nr:hypothetical protein BOTBODRAFT_483702 [Botryobasidium botryosum FD-172 SS1]
MKRCKDWIQSFSAGATQNTASLYAPYIQNSRRAHSPPVVYSEQDTELWVKSVLLQPSLNCLRARIYRSFAYNPEQICPFIASSSHSTKTVPDFQLVKELPEESAVTGEVKVHTVVQFRHSQNEDGTSTQNLFADIQNTSVPSAGNAMRFVWPEPHAVVSVTKLTKLFVQVWTQMIKKNTNFAILSTYEGTMFFVRDEHDTLYFSQAYHSHQRPLLAITCFFMVAMGLIPFENLRLPAHDAAWSQTLSARTYPQGFSGFDAGQ